MVQLWTYSQSLSTHNCYFQKPWRIFRVPGLSRSFLTVHDAEASLDDSKVHKTTLGNDGNSMKGVLVLLSLWIHTTKFNSMALCGGRLDILKRCHLPRQLFPEGKMVMTKLPPVRVMNYTWKYSSQLRNPCQMWVKSSAAFESIWA